MIISKAISIALVSFFATSIQATTLGDDFSASTIDSSKWRNGEYWRTVKNEKLTMGYSSTGSLTSDTGSAGGGPISRARLAGSIASFQATITINTINPGDDCPSNLSGYKSAGIRLRASLFNTNNSPALGDRSGDIIGEIYISKSNSQQVPMAFGSLYQCLNSVCSSMSRLNYGFISEVGIGLPIKTKLTLNKSLKKVVFMIDSNTISFPYTVNTGSTPIENIMTLETLAYAANCTAGTRTSEISGLFDNIAVTY